MLINLHTHDFHTSDGIAVVNQYPHDFREGISMFSIGIHPWHIEAMNLANAVEFIESRLKLSECVAVGECGLDRKIGFPFDKQVEIFETQIGLAEKYKKPVIVHCVGAFQELIEIKNRLKVTVPMIVHGFRKHLQLAQQLLDNGFYLSFGKGLLLNPEYAETFNAIPNEAIFLETDSAQIDIKAVYQAAAKYKDISGNELQEIIKTNYIKVFGEIPIPIQNK